MSDQNLTIHRSYDGWYTYHTPSGSEGHCYVQVYEPRGGIPVVLVTEAPNNPGPSVPYVSDIIATQIWHELVPNAREGFRVVQIFLDPARCVSADLARPKSLVAALIQGTAETLLEVSYTIDGDRLTRPEYKATTRVQLQALIGGPFSVPFTRSY
ncbi:MAG TPA: hypothetical protein VKF37_00725 [Chloroflexota bacterium]|nr:hypothetical protein [Chloroflexota bacterium]